MQHSTISTVDSTVAILYYRFTTLQVYDIGQASGQNITSKSPAPLPETTFIYLRNTLLTVGQSKA